MVDCLQSAHLVNLDNLFLLIQSGKTQVDLKPLRHLLPLRILLLPFFPMGHFFPMFGPTLWKCHHLLLQTNWLFPIHYSNPSDHLTPEFSHELETNVDRELQAIACEENASHTHDHKFPCLFQYNSLGP